MSAAVPHQFRWLQNGRQVMRRMQTMLGRARRSVRMEFYIYAADHAGHAITEALIEAARRGAQVRVLVDAVGSAELPNGYWTALEAAGGTVREFNPLKLRRLPIRDHRKLVVIDDEYAGVGGFNVAEEYAGDGVTHGWADLGLAITGPGARKLGEEFDRMWDLAEEPQKWFARIRKGQRPPPVAVSPDLELLWSGPGRSASAFQMRLEQDFRTAKRIQIASAYFLPTRKMRRLLRSAARRGVPVQVIVPGKTDVQLSRRAAQHLYAGMLRGGIEVYEYEPQVFHVKLVVTDCAAYVGSANLDTRSLHINYELMVRVSEAEAREEGERLFDLLRSRSRRIDLREWNRSRSYWQRIQQAFAFWVLARADPYLTRWLASPR